MSYSVEVIINNLDESTSKEFEIAAIEFVEKLALISELQVETQTKKVEGTRGALTLLSGIYVTAQTIGAFMAIYIILYSKWLIF